MIVPRVIPCLLLKGRGLVKTTKFSDPKYLGDPRNAVRIFNEREVDELVVLDITATQERRRPQFDVLREIVSEAFMPVAYGGGIQSIDDARSMLAQGLEKIIVCTHAVQEPAFVSEAAQILGSQSVVVWIDAKKDTRKGYEAYTHGGQKTSGLDPACLARQMQVMGAGELVINSIDRDGTMSGYDLELTSMVTRAVDIPVIASGGAGTIQDLKDAVEKAGAAAVAAGSLFVFQGKLRSVLINYPDHEELVRLFEEQEGAIRT